MPLEIRKNCPWCGFPLQVTVDAESKQEIFECIRCQHSEPLTVEQVLRRRGEKTLPGLE